MTAAEVLASFLDATGGETVYHHAGTLPLRVLVTVAVHGDETGPLWSAAELVRALHDGRQSCAVHLTILVGNPVAVLAGRRFVEEDLNRAVRLVPRTHTVEGRRAERLKPVLRETEFLLELHQTRGPMAPGEGPFAIGSYHPKREALVQALGIDTWCVSAPRSFHAPELGVSLVEEYAEHHGALTLTVEVGQRGVRPECTSATTAIFERLILTAERLARGEPLAPAGPGPIRILELAHKEPYSAPEPLMQELPNLSWVDEGTVVTEGHSPVDLAAPVDGYMLFAKFGKIGPPAPLYAYRLFRELPDPSARWPIK